MFSESPELYDSIYATLKNYKAEAARLAQLLRELNPESRTVLDMACGTGEHARFLASSHGFEVDGMDLEPTFVAIASRKNPTGEFVVADMASFRLSKQYDAIVCLFGSIGYLKTLDRVISSLRCVREHLAPGGVAIVEPWFAPGELDTGRVTRHTSAVKGVRVERVSHTEISGRLSRLRFDYTISDGLGMRQATEIHELGLFTTTELLGSFQEAGICAYYDPDGLTGRGLYIARSTV